MESEQELTFAVMAGSERAAIQALILARSIRTFGDRLSDRPILLLVPKAEDRLPRGIRNDLAVEQVRLIDFDLDEEASEFPFAVKAFAAAAAESEAEGGAGLLVWMDSDTIVINQPREFLLPQGKALGYRPVHHMLIGSPYEEPPDKFWELVYRYCIVSEEAVFPMRTCADNRVIRPYFNAGLLAVRPERRLLRRWRENFQRLYRAPAFEQFYEQNRLYRIFIHQAILTGTILATLHRDEMEEFSDRINYPLHLHSEYHHARRAESLNELITCRYEDLSERPDWEGIIRIEEPLKSWLSGQLGGKSQS